MYKRTSINGTTLSIFLLQPSDLPLVDSFAPCAGLRLLFPDVLHDLDRVLYVDTDVVFLQSPSVVWREFDGMNATQMVAMAEENAVKE